MFGGRPGSSWNACFATLDTGMEFVRKLCNSVECAATEALAAHSTLKLLVCDGSRLLASIAI